MNSMKKTIKSIKELMPSIQEEEAVLDSFNRWNSPASKGIEGEADGHILSGSEYDSFGNFPVGVGIQGDGGDNIITGDANITEHIYGLGGNDTIYGGLQDRLYGGDGDDVLVGGAGYNQFLPGPGSDTIVLNDVGAAYRDDISWFNAAEDTIHLNSAVFKGLAKGVLSADLFYIGNKAAGIWNPGAEDRILYNKSQGTLYFKTDTGTVVTVAAVGQIAGTPDPSHLDFFVI